MKPKPTLRHFLALALAGSSLLAISSASAQTTYTWTQKTTGTQSWVTDANWDGSNIFVSGASNELRFFLTNSSTDRLANGAVITIIDVPSTLSMNTLTLSGQGPNNTNGAPFTIGTNASTWTLGDLTTSTVNLDSTRGGGSADRDIRYTVAANLALSGGTGGITTFTGNSQSITGAVFSGNITETSAGQGITKSGTSLLIFSGSNSYTGTTSVTGGTLRLNSSNALSGGIGATGGTSALTINGGVVELGVTDFNRNLGTGSDQFQITGGTSGFSAIGGPRVITVNGDASQELQWGSAHFAPTTLVLNAATANDSLELANRLDLNNATRTVQVDANKALLSGDIRNGGLTKTGNGTLVLTGNNTYNGNTTISAGTLSVGGAGNFGSGSSGLIMNGGTLQITGTALTSISDLGHTVTFNNNAKGFDIHNASNTFTVDQALSGTTLLKSGVGTLALNQNNTFTGATTATGGGSLVLDYSTNNGSKLADTQALNLNGSNLVLRAGSHTEAIGSISLAVNTGNSISRDGGSSATIANAGALSTGTQSNLTIAEAGIVSTTTANVNGIQTLGRVSVGSHFATRDGSGLLQEYGSYTDYTAGAGGGDRNTVNQLTGGGTMTGNLTSYSLRIANDGNSNVLDLGTNRQLNVENGGTVLYAGGFDDNYTINGTTANARVGTANGNQPLNMNIFSGTLTVNATLTSGGGGRLIKAGAGTLVVGGTNAYTSDTFIQQGVLRLTNASGLGTTQTGTFVQGGAALELSNDISVGAEALEINGTGISNGGALRNQAGSNSFAGLITIGASGARINADTGSSLTLTGGIATTLTQDVTFGGAGNTTVSTAAISGSGSLIKDGAGTLTLSAANTYTGATTVSAGTLYVTGSLTSSEVSVSADGTLGGNGTLGNGLTIAAGGILDLTGATLGLNSNDILGITGGTLTLGNLTFQDIVGWDWANAVAGTYELIDGGFSVDFGSTAFLDQNSAYDFGNGKGGYFTSGSLNAVVFVIPEPSTALLSTLGLLALLHRRR